MADDKPKPEHKTKHKDDDARWNHSIHYWRKLEQWIPDGPGRALDVGTGEGFVARDLAARKWTVTAIDSDHDSIESAREQDTNNITYIEGDVMTADLPRGSFDVVSAVGVIHHLELEPALERLKDLLAPGGHLLIVGLAWSKWPMGMLWDIGGSFYEKPYRLFRGYWNSGSPTVWPPPHSFGDVSRAAAVVLPGSIYQRKVIYRYTIRWTKPDA